MTIKTLRLLLFGCIMVAAYSSTISLSMDNSYTKAVGDTVNDRLGISARISSQPDQLAVDFYSADNFMLRIRADVQKKAIELTTVNIRYDQHAMLRNRLLFSTFTDEAQRLYPETVCIRTPKPPKGARNPEESRRLQFLEFHAKNQGQNDADYITYYFPKKALPVSEKTVTPLSEPIPERMHDTERTKKLAITMGKWVVAAAVVYGAIKHRNSIVSGIKKIVNTTSRLYSKIPA